MNRTTRSATGIALALLLVGVLLWARRDAPPQPSSAPSTEPLQAPEAAIPDAPRPTSAEPVAGDASSASGPVVGALEALELPRAHRLRCGADLADGLYESLPGAAPARVRFITVQDGELFAAAWSESGEVWVARERQRVASLRWTGAAGAWSTCSVEPVELASVSGVVRPGTDARAVHTVVGCRAGEVAEVGGDGTFTLPAVVGSVCHLIAIGEQGERFGRGDTLSVVVSGPVGGLELVGPSEEELWTPERQIEIAGQMLRMGDAGLVARQAQERPEITADVDGPEAAWVEAWVEQEERRQREMLRQLDGLDDPEQVRMFLVEAFLGLY